MEWHVRCHLVLGVLHAEALSSCNGCEAWVKGGDSGMASAGPDCDLVEFTHVLLLLMHAQLHRDTPQRANRFD